MVKGCVSALHPSLRGTRVEVVAEGSIGKFFEVGLGLRLRFNLSRRFLSELRRERRRFCFVCFHFVQVGRYLLEYCYRNGHCQSANVSNDT